MPIVTAPPVHDLLSIEKLREQELEEARIIQSAMLPSRPLHEFDIIISYEFQPIEEVGGDYLDYFLLTDGTIGLYLGDVSGKGLPAALYAALAVGTLRGIHKTGQRPGRVLSLFNERLLLRNIPGRHSAIQYAIFYPATGEMVLSNAGMPGPFLLRQGECRPLQVAGIPPGLLGGVIYDELSVQLEPGDSMLFCTDGVTEARNGHDEEFGTERLQELCRNCYANTPLVGAPVRHAGRVHRRLPAMGRHDRHGISLRGDLAGPPAGSKTGNCAAFLFDPLAHLT